mmetsp:Transcript_19703/g.40159  ORF Transcript_19703/g.40159 Transcript_19703/m.40159 type:complete len:269 (-) Transcript_19703:32-838(-)|eukprot:CAMPEP_0181300768 /NCGR_PEP_ID=MMETSP1101-20121128/7065_1 /TAXON_ID=46948 /ORGANISM="Rhodomonas abbreviata, Strain Caron Lab Isolate" /LENGTH=268 /DNA_ID=CAMNT_0023406025 /DNA_START=286 /DNA_END=1092 /DNA_ORIENTATION=-
MFLVNAVTFFPRIVLLAPTYAYKVAVGSNSQSQEEAGGVSKLDLNGVVVEPAVCSKDRSVVGLEENSKEIDVACLDESAQGPVVLQWWRRRWSPLKENNLISLQDDDGYSDDILERYLEDQIDILEASSHSQVAGLENFPLFEQDQDSMPDPLPRDSVSSTAAFEPHSELDMLRESHDLFELRESHQWYEQAWWDSCLGTKAWNEDSPLVAFSYRPPLFKSPFRFELCYGSANAASPPFIRLWNFSLNLNVEKAAASAKPLDDCANEC